MNGPALRLAFFGTPAFAVPTLARLLASRHAVVGVITQPDRPRGRGYHVHEGAVAALARAHEVPILQPERLAHDAFRDTFAALRPDLGIVAAYGKLLPEWLLGTPRLGMVNVHASLLPRYRGAAPIQRAVVAGETETGITIMRVVKALDAGPMIAKAVRPIGRDDTSIDVERDLARLGADLLMDSLEALAAGAAREEPQEDGLATYAPRLTRADSAFEWSMPAEAIHNRVRGLQPWPRAVTSLNGLRYILQRTTLPDGWVDAQPGTVTRVDPHAIRVACGDARSLDLLALQPEGRKVMSSRELTAGHAVVVGDLFV